MNETNSVNIGDRFGYLIVLSKYSKDKYSHIRYLCKCECGNETIVLKSQLTSGKTKSCGCYQRKRAAEAQFKHGMCHTKIYYVWKEMLQRCNNQNNLSFINYGDRGIEVCDKWKNNDGFINFYNWAMNNGYRDGLEIDRINNDGNYNPDNCRWASRFIQANNKRNNIVIKYKGNKMTVSEWSRVLGIDEKKIRQRIRKLGWSGEKAISIK